MRDSRFYMLMSTLYGLLGNDWPHVLGSLVFIIFSALAFFFGVQAQWLMYVMTRIYTRNRF